MEELDVLQKVARADLYRVNAFRVTGLPVDATPRETSRHLDKMKMAEKLGGQLQQASGALALDPAPDGDAVREALERLRDPETRLVDEFLWFWPATFGQSKDDPALQALAQGHLGDASQAWQLAEQQPEGSAVAQHNLAVLSHVLALDLEHKIAANGAADSGTKAERRKKLAEYWGASFSRWRTLLDDERFWERLTDRIRDLDEPQLTAGTARRLRISLPVALLSINSQLALRAAEENRSDEARRHVRLVEESGFEPADVENALRRAAEPVRERIKVLCQAALVDTDVNPQQAAQASWKLLQETRRSLAILDCLLGPAHFTCEDGHDEVALTALSCQIAYGNATKDWAESVKLLEATLPIAASASARSRVDENLKIVRDNVEHDTCWFCKHNRWEETSAAEVPMHGNVQRMPVFNGYRLLWNQLKFRVPRCPQCKAYHATEWAFTIVGALVLGAFGLYAAFNSKIDGGWVAAFFGAALGIVVGVVIDFIRHPRTIKWGRARRTFPAVKTLVNQGWRFGARPGG